MPAKISASESIEPSVTVSSFLQMLLYKAADLGMRLSAAFKSDTGIPYSDVNLQTHNVHQPPWTQFSSLSEVSTLSLEFTYLERAAGALPAVMLLLL